MTDNYNEPSGTIPTGSILWDSSWPELARENDRKQLILYLEERFGIPANLLDDYLLFEKKRTWWLLRSSPSVIWASSLKVSTYGLRAFEKVGSFVKPTTRMIQVFGRAATRARLDIDERQFHDLLVGKELPFSLDLENGYVILSLNGQVLGLGLYINGLVRSQIRRSELRPFLSSFDNISAPSI